MSQEARTRPATRIDSRILWVAAGLLLLAVLFGWIYTASRPETATVVRRDIVVTLPLEGTVVAPPAARADLGAPYAAPVERVYASVGQQVKPGDVLVELSHPSAQAAYEQARREVTAAEAAYAEAQRQANVAVEAARRELEAARAAERNAREAATPAVEPADGAVTITVPDPTPALNEATAARIAAEQALLQAQADRQAALIPHRQRLDAARAALKEAQAGRRQAMIRAPISGTVLALNARPGQQLTADGKTPVATIVDLRRLQVHAPMSAEEADAVKPGARVWVQFEGLPGERFEGKVERVTTQPGGVLRRGTRFLALIAFENEQGLAKPDMKAAVRVRLGQAENVLAVPEDAVDRDDQGRPTVAVLRGGRWQEVVVEPGLSDGRYTAIRSGLNEGETVRARRGLL